MKFDAFKVLFFSESRKLLDGLKCDLMLSFLWNEGGEFLVVVFGESGKFFLQFVKFNLFGWTYSSFVWIFLELKTSFLEMIERFSAKIFFESWGGSIRSGELLFVDKGGYILELVFKSLVLLDSGGVGKNLLDQALFASVVMVFVWAIYLHRQW